VSRLTIFRAEKQVDQEAQWQSNVATAVSAVKWKLFRQLFSIWRPYFNRQLVKQKAAERGGNPRRLRQLMAQPFLMAAPEEDETLID